MSNIGNPDQRNVYNAQKFGKPDLDQEWTDAPFSSGGSYEQEENPMLGEMPHHPLHVKVVDAQTQEIAAEFSAWTAQFPILAGAGVATQICPHRYHRDSCRMAWSVPAGYTVFLANKPDYLSSPNPPTGSVYQITNGNNPALVYEGQQPLYAVYTGAGQTPSQPAVPASGTAVQNPNSYPVTVVISGGAATQTFVNGILVGGGDGTYVVPAYGSISITYTVAPTWVWSNANGNTPPWVSILDMSYGTVQ
jgi:hypothetical protein